MYGMREEGTASHSQYFEETTKQYLPNDTGVATIRVVGSLGNLPDGRRINTFEVGAPAKLAYLLKELEREYGTELRRDSMLVLVNGVEAGALDELETLIRPGDTVVLLPMFHGG